MLDHVSDGHVSHAILPFSICQFFLGFLLSFFITLRGKMAAKLISCSISRNLAFKYGREAYIVCSMQVLPFTLDCNRTILR